ncbi:MAG: ABC transporter ATP-binding protein [Candidatus Hodarchaeales archaeon]
MPPDSKTSSAHSEAYLPPKWYTRSYRYWLFGHVLQHKWKITIIVITTIIGIFLQTLIPFILGYVFEVAIPSGDVGLVVGAGWVVIFVGVGKLITNSIAAALNEIIAQYVEMQIRIEFYHNLESKSMSFHDSSRVGDLIQMATGDTRQINASISPGVRITVTTIFTLLFTGVAMLIASPSLSLVFLLTLPLYLFFLSRFGKKLNPLSVKRQEVVARMNAELQENLTGVRVVRTFSGQEREIKKFSQTLDELEDILKVRGITSAFYIPSLVLGITTALIFIVGVYLIEATLLGPFNIDLGIVVTIQRVGMGELITFLGLTGILAMPTMFLRWILDMTLLGFAGANRIFKVVIHEDVLKSGEYKPRRTPNGHVRFNNVSFSYQEDTPRVLNDVSFEIQPGETVALIGPTGCGKTTLGKMIYRLYDVISGSVEIDGVDIREWEIPTLRRLVGVIEQDTFLFSTSIRNNIAFGKENATNEEIMAAAIASQAHDFIEEFPDAYDTIVGERGVTLSGGQRQRIAMARGFLANPKILIMDDATSAVDAATEHKIQKAIQNILKDRTTLIITHRLATLKTADKIIFMEKGQIVRVGTHSVLITSFAPYRRIFKRYMTLPPLVVEGGT